MIFLIIVHKIESQYTNYLNNCFFKTFLTPLICILNIANGYILKWYHIGFVFPHWTVRTLRMGRDFCSHKHISAVVFHIWSVLLASHWHSEIQNLCLDLWGKSHIEWLNSTPEPHYENGDLNRNVRSIHFSILETWFYENMKVFRTTKYFLTYKYIWKNIYIFP